MCGIYVLISACATSEIPVELRRCLCNRGPDHTATHDARLENESADAPATHLSFTSTVLALRGDHIAKQPFVDPQSTSVLCWNGEAWRFRHHDIKGNDGEAIARLLAEAIQQDAAEREAAILKVLRSIDGPFAFAFFDKPSKKLYYGRDRLGRRSLLIQHDHQQFILSSVAGSVDARWNEVEADGIYVLDLNLFVPNNKSDAAVSPAARLDWLDDGDNLDFVSYQSQRALQALPSTTLSPNFRLQIQGFIYWKV